MTRGWKAMAETILLEEGCLSWAPEAGAIEAGMFPESKRYIALRFSPRLSMISLLTLKGQY